MRIKINADIILHTKKNIADNSVIDFGINDKFFHY